MSLTVVILTLNEESNIVGALRSSSFADEQLIVDSGSTDSTVGLAVAAGARILERPFGDFARQRNFALDNVSTGWVFFLDADERISPALAAELARFVGEASEGDASHPDASRPAAYRVPRHSIALGQRLDWHPGGTDAPIRLVRAGSGRFEGAVHERFVVSGPTGQLQGSLEHRTHRSVSDLVQRIDRYSTLEATQQAEAGARVLPPWRLLWTLTSTAWRYWRQGLKQHGMAGAIEACSLAYDRVLVAAKIWEHRNSARIADAYREQAPDAHSDR